MSGPCLCGDPYCPRCGNPSLAKLEAAQDWAAEQFANADLDENEYKLAVAVGLAAVTASRELVANALAGERAVYAEAIAEIEKAALDAQTLAVMHAVATAPQ